MSVVFLVRHHPWTIAGALFLLALLIVAIAPDWIAAHDPLSHDVPNRLRGPSGDHWFGTDTLGRDVFSRVLHGARTSLFVGFVSTGAATLVGVALGLLAGYLRGPLDTAAQRIIDALLAFPPLVLALVAVAAFGGSLVSLTIALAVATAPAIMRFTRAVVIPLEQEAYVMAAVATGAGVGRILFRHIAPNGAGVVLVFAAGFVGEALAAESALHFLKVGIPPPTPTWGGMLQDGVTRYLYAAPWLTLFPALALGSTLLSLAAIADALRDVADTRARRQ